MRRGWAKRQPFSFSFAEPSASIGKGMLGQRAFEITRLRGVAMVSMERRKRPILDLVDMAMLHWIEPTIIDVVVKIAFVADEVLPITALPDTALAARFADGTELLSLWD